MRGGLRTRQLQRRGLASGIALLSRRGVAVLAMVFIRVGDGLTVRLQRVPQVVRGHFPPPSQPPAAAPAHVCWPAHSAAATVARSEPTWLPTPAPPPEVRFPRPRRWQLASHRHGHKLPDPKLKRVDTERFEAVAVFIRHLVRLRAHLKPSDASVQRTLRATGSGLPLVSRRQPPATLLLPLRQHVESCMEVAMPFSSRG